MSSFTNPNDPDGSKTRQTLSIWLGQMLDIGADETIEITEIACSEASCLHTETVFATNNAIYRIPKPLVYIRKSDLQKAIAQPTQLRHVH